MFGWICLGLMASMLAGVVLAVALWPLEPRVEVDVMQQPHGDQPRLPQ
jgi:hypothetical protein